jgi:hypothetical protein
MPVIILCLFRFVRLLGSGHQAIVVENLALRWRLAAFKRKRKKPLLTRWDRLFWVGLSRLWSWRDALVFVQPDTVVLAAGTVPQVLGSTISTQAWSPAKTRHRRRCSTPCLANGYGQSPMARAADHWANLTFELGLSF